MADAGRKGNWEKASVLHVVNPDEADFFGNPHSKLDEGLHQVSGGVIVGAQECIWPVPVEDRANLLRFIGVQPENKVLIARVAMSKQGFAVAEQVSEHPR